LPAFFASRRAFRERLAGAAGEWARVYVGRRAANVEVGMPVEHECSGVQAGMNARPPPAIREMCDPA